MPERIHHREWASNDGLPSGFSEWLRETVREYEMVKKMAYRQIAAEFGVNPSILSRWISGMGPMTHTDIQLLASRLSPVVYAFLGLEPPPLDGYPAENSNLD